MATPHLKLPSKPTIAFALSIVRSKPEDLSIKDYIQLLCQHFAKGRRDNTLSSSHRHLDRSSYWRSECERVLLALRSAEAETVDLKREIESVKGKLEVAKPAATTSARKRRKNDEDVILYPRSPKKVRRQASPSTGGRDAEKEYDFSGVGEVGDVFMRALWQVHAALKSRSGTEAAVLACHLIRVAKALPPIINELVKRSYDDSIADTAHVKTTLSAASRAVLSLVVGVNRLSRATSGADVQGSVIYAYVHMFSDVLDIFEQVSAIETQRDDAAQGSTTIRKKDAKAKQASKPTTSKDNSTLDALTTFLCSILDLLNANSEVHKSLFEGLAYCVFTKVGARLYITTFGTARGTTIEDEILATGVTDHSPDKGDAATPWEHNMQVRQAIIEAPHLIYLLKRIMAASPSLLGGSKTSRAKRADSGTNDKGSSVKGALALEAKNRLQRTLINSVFGMEGLQDDDPLLWDCLKAPVVPGAVEVAMPKGEKVDVREWFGEEVWRVCGWEVLAKEGSLLQ